MWFRSKRLYRLSSSQYRQKHTVGTAEQLKHVVFQDEGSSRRWQLHLEGAEVMLCKRVQLSSQGDWPEAHGVCSYRGNPLTYFCILGRLCRHMGLLKCLSIPRVLFQNHNGVSAKSRDTRVGELWGLTSFFGYSTQTFVQAVNLLDRFLAIMKVRT